MLGTNLKLITKNTTPFILEKNKSLSVGRLRNEIWLINHVSPTQIKTWKPFKLKVSNTV